MPYKQPQASCPTSLHTSHSHPFIKMMKPTVMSVKHNLYFSGIRPSYMYMFWLSISHHQAVYCSNVYYIRDESPWDHPFISHNHSRWHCILKLLTSTVSTNRWYLLQDEDKRSVLRNAGFHWSLIICFILPTLCMLKSFTKK